VILGLSLVPHRSSCYLTVPSFLNPFVHRGPLPKTMMSYRDEGRGSGWIHLQFLQIPCSPFYLSLRSHFILRGYYVLSGIERAVRIQPEGSLSRGIRHLSSQRCLSWYGDPITIGSRLQIHYTIPWYTGGIRPRGGYRRDVGYSVMDLKSYQDTLSPTSALTHPYGLHSGRLTTHTNEGRVSGCRW